MEKRRLHPQAARLLRFCLFLICLYLAFAVGYAASIALSDGAVLELLHSGALSVTLAVCGALLYDLESRTRGK
ncbi:MAG: hypothetical protein IJU41_08425 [Clostridia bacterium]|nr:hypothetical protein [Clostridia bacterium]